MKTIILTGGGTAGHVTPNLALLPSLKEEGYDVHYIGSYNGIEKNLIDFPNNYHEAYTYDFKPIENKICVHFVPSNGSVVLMHPTSYQIAGHWELRE